MTALNEFERLESPGIWRAAPDEQRRDVIVSVGDATLIIADQKETALSHWSLPAVERMNPGERPALFRPAPDSSEVLELADETMIKAMAKVHSAIERRKPHPGRIRHIAVAAFAVLFAVIVFVWLPAAMTRYTASVVPSPSRVVIGHALLENIRRVSGPSCDNSAGNAALDQMHRRLLGQKVGAIKVLTAGVQLSEHLPGGIILLNRGMVEDYETPEVAAGFVLMEDQRALKTDPLLRMLETTGFLSAFKLLTTGTMPEKYLQEYGEYLLTAEKQVISNTTILDRFEKAKIRTSPYAFALDVSGETTLPLIEADPTTTGDAIPVLSDGKWVALQGICGE